MIWRRYIDSAWSDYMTQDYVGGYFSEKGSSKFCRMKYPETATIIFDDLTGVLQSEICTEETPAYVDYLSAYPLGLKKMFRIYGDLDQVQNFYCYNNSFESNFDWLLRFENLERVALYGTDFTDDISKLIGNWVNIISLSLCLTDVYGYITDIFDNKPNVQSVYLYNTDVEGDIYNFAVCNSLLLAQCQNTNISGYINWLPNNSGMTELNFSNTDVGVSEDGLKAWDGVKLYFENCSWSSAETDRFLNQAYAAGVQNCNIKIAGTNAARTSASDTAYTWLLANNTSLEVN